VRLYRIADSRFAPESGEGARIYGARWNSPGRAVIYACTSYAGAMLEKLVHTGRRIPKHQVCVTFEYPNALHSEVVDPQSVAGWSDANMYASRRFGDAWLVEARTAILLVPSVVFEQERNALINPVHPAASRIRTLSIEPVRWDDRLFPPEK
jgi:RES domain-containing protein